MTRTHWLGMWLENVCFVCLACTYQLLDIVNYLYSLSYTILPSESWGSAASESLVSGVGLSGRLLGSNEDTRWRRLLLLAAGAAVVFTALVTCNRGRLRKRVSASGIGVVTVSCGCMRESKILYSTFWIFDAYVTYIMAPILEGSNTADTGVCYWMWS